MIFDVLVEEGMFSIMFLKVVRFEGDSDWKACRETPTDPICTIGLVL